MRIVDIVYDDYALVHTIKTKDGVSEVLNKLYSKSAISHTAAAGAVCPCGGWVGTVCSTGGFRIEFKHLILCLQVALLRPTLPCS